MNKLYDWISERKRKKFIERQNKNKQLPNNIETKNIVEIPKSIAVMLDIGGTCDFINDEKAKKFINQLDILRKKFGAATATISISTHYGDSEKIKELLEILVPNLVENVKIGLNFFYGGIYDYDKKEDILKGYSFNSDKVSTFASYYVNSSEVNNEWFAIIDDSIDDDTYKRYKQERPMLVCKPTQFGEETLSKNNFMSISTSTMGIDGVIELLDTYINSIKSLTPIQIMETQKNMMTHLSSWDLIEIIREHNYAFLERYFKEGYADEADYKDSLNWIVFTSNDSKLTRDELTHLRSVLEIMTEHFKNKNETESIESILSLQKKLKSNDK